MNTIGRIHALVNKLVVQRTGALINQEWCLELSLRSAKNLRIVATICKLNGALTIDFIKVTDWGLEMLFIIVLESVNLSLVLLSSIKVTRKLKCYIFINFESRTRFCERCLIFSLINLFWEIVNFCLSNTVSIEDSVRNVNNLETKKLIMLALDCFL